MRRIDYFNDLIKSVYNNLKVDFEHSDDEPTILIGKSGLTDKCKFQNKGSSARYYTRVFDLLKHTFISENSIFVKTASKKIVRFNRETAVANTYQYLLRIGMSENNYTLLDSDGSKKNTILFQILANYILPIIFWGNLPDSENTDIANDDLEILFKEASWNINAWLTTKAFFLTKHQSLRDRDCIIDTDFANICGNELNSQSLGTCNFAVPMQLSDLLDIVPYFQITLTLPLSLLEQSCSYNKLSNNEMREGFYPINQDKLSLSSSSPFKINVESFANRISDEPYPFLPDVIPLDLLSTEVLFLTNLSDEVLDTKYKDIQTKDALCHELQKKAKQCVSRQKPRYYVQKREYYLSVIDYIVSIINKLASIDVHEYLSITNSSLVGLSNTLQSLDLPLEDMWERLQNVKKDKDKCLAIYCATDIAINKFTNSLLFSNKFGTELTFTNVLRRSISSEELYIRAQSIADLIKSSFFDIALEEEIQDCFWNPEKYQHPCNLEQMYQ